jgi:hypothetical protein
MRRKRNHAMGLELGRSLAWQRSIQLPASLAKAWMDLWQRSVLAVLQSIRMDLSVVLGKFMDMVG